MTSDLLIAHDDMALRLMDDYALLAKWLSDERVQRPQRNF